MQLSDFISLIQGKIFVSIETNQDVSEFTSLESTGIALRNAAVESGVIVFLPSLNKIFARGRYYGVSESEMTTINDTLTSLTNNLNTLTSSISTLTGLVQDNTSDISDNSDAISSHTTQIQEISDDIADIQTLLSDLPANKTLSEIISDTVEDAIEDALSGYDLANIATQLANKADASEFNTFKTSLLERLNEFDNENETIETVIQSIKNSISAIPKFNIVVVENKAALNNIVNPSPTTIYIIPKTNEEDAEEVFTEFIYVNKNAGQKDSETGEDLPENWAWEKLGSQEFSINTIVSKEELEAAILELGQDIEGKAPASLVQTVDTNSLAITNLQSTVQAIQTSLNSLLDNQGNFLFTGEDIKTTSDQNSNTIATDISNLNANKLDATAINWVVINE